MLIRPAYQETDMTRSADRRDDPRDRDELQAQLDELSETLSALKRELRSEQRRTPPKPPSLSELLRFTEQYTIPTLIALLEATIQSLELLRRTLRLADPTRAAREEGERARGRLDQVGTEAGAQLAGALAELRTALSETDLPENSESRQLIDDARGLTGEIESRLRDAERTVRDQRDTEQRGNQDTPRSRGVMIDVTDDSAPDDRTERSDEQPASESTDEAPPAVDVDAELESIKSQLDRVREDETVQADEMDREDDIDNDDDSGMDSVDTGDDTAADDTGDDPK